VSHRARPPCTRWPALRRVPGRGEAQARRRRLRRLLLRTLALLEDDGVAERIRGQIDYLFVDEFQDTDRTQARILSRLARDRSGAFGRAG